MFAGTLRQNENTLSQQISQLVTLCSYNVQIQVKELKRVTQIQFSTFQYLIKCSEQISIDGGLL